MAKKPSILENLHLRRRTFFLLHFSLLLLCLSVFLNEYIKPSTFTYFGIVALVFPVLFILYSLITIISLYRGWKYFLFFAFFLFFLWLPFKRTYNVRLSQNKKDTFQQKIKVFSFNSRYAYDTNLNELENYFDRQNADIVFLQEIYTRQWREKESFLTNKNNAVYPYVGISSKFPIINSKLIPLPFNGHSCMADIIINEDTIRAINLYLEPMYLTKKILEFNSTSELTEKTIIVKNKLAEGFQIHQKQVEIIKQYIKNSPFPVLLSGDFNSVPNSYEYYTLTNNLNDSFLNAGKGLGTTFHDYFYPIRIDYILYDDNFSSENFYIDRSKKMSDHFPISVELQLKRKTNN